MFEMFDLEKKVKVAEYNIRSGLIRWQTSKSINVIFFNFDFQHDTSWAQKNRTHTRRQTNVYKQTNKATARGEIADLPKNVLKGKHVGVTDEVDVESQELLMTVNDSHKSKAHTF